MRINSCTKLFTLLVFLLIGNMVFAQSNSEYAVRFNYHSLDCANTIYIDIEVKADVGQPRFFIAEQNYRFSFEDDVLTNPRIVEELEISGALQGNEHLVFFNDHNINGSLDTIVSYNVEMGGGTGYPVDETRWYPVGRIAFDIIGSGCVFLKWHTQDPNDFPPTAIIEKFGGSTGTLHTVAEGSYDNGGTDGPSEPEAITCDPQCLPIELASFDAFDRGCKTELQWVTQTETDNAYFSIEKSTDGERWNSIGEVPGAGTSIDPIEYSFMDENITSLISYYRLKQVDIDETSSTTDSRTIRSSCYNDQVTVTEMYPNPVKGAESVTIEYYTATSETADIVVTDELGRKVKVFPQEMTEGRNTLIFSGSSLAPGIYFVQIKGLGWFSEVQKLVKLGA